MNQDPLYLQSLMRYEAKKSKNQFDIDFDKEIDRAAKEYLDQLPKTDIDHTFENPKQREETVKLKIKEALKLPELSQQLDQAISILLKDGTSYLSKEDFDRLTHEFQDANKIFSQIKLEETTQFNLQDLCHISDESMLAIVNVGVAKYSEKQYLDCLALFALLTTLDPTVPEYWLRYGLAAYVNDKDEIALKAYEVALDLNPNFVEARLFAAECYIKQDMFNEAKEEYLVAKKLLSESKEKSIWSDMISKLEELLQKS